MADVSVKMGVSGISQFKQGMNESAAAVKALDSALKLNEKTLKSTGDAENYMQQKTQLLNQKLDAQRNAVKNAENALKTMANSGVNPLSTAYQNMQRQLLDAQSAVLDTESEIQNLGNQSAGAANKANQLSNSLQGLNKRISLDQVISAIGTITDGMERAAKKAVELGRQIWENITDTARYSDDTATQAMILNMDVEEYQKYKNVFDTTAELTVQEWQKAKMKVQKAINDPSQDQTDILSLLGIQTHDIVQGKYGPIQGAAKDFEEIFWAIGETLRDRVASGEMTQDLADTYANALFGKGFGSLNPIFKMGREAFEQEVNEQVVASEEAIQKSAELNDKLIRLQGDFQELKVEVLSGLAPALTSAATAIDGLLTRIMAYLETPEGQAALETMATAVSGMFEDLGKIDPDQVTEGFAKVFGDIVGGIQWLNDNWGSVVTAIEGIAIAFGGLKVAESVLTFLQLIAGLKGLRLGGGGTETPTTTEAAEETLPWLARFGKKILESDMLRYMTAAGAFVTVLSGEAGAEGAISEDELKQYNQEHALEIFGQRMKLQYNKIREQAEKVNIFDMFGGGEITENVNLDEDYPFHMSPSQWEAAQNFWDTFKETSIFDPAWEQAYQELFDHFQWSEDDLNQMTNLVDMLGKMKENGELYEDLPENWINKELWPSDEPIEVPAEPQLTESGPADLQAVLDGLGLTAPVSPYFDLSGFEGMPWLPHANGLSYVPFDGYPALLHKGEQVVPAREVASRNYSSNLYVESMVMNNGQDAEGLAAAIAAANRRTMRGFGS